MTEFPYLDPLVAAQSLFDYVVGKEGQKGTVEELALHVDAFMYALRFLLVDEVASIQETDDEAPDFAKENWRDIIGPRFSMLGLYWETATSRMVGTENPEIVVGDAIDDLDDIVREINKAKWYLVNCGRDEALAALRWCYESHLYMHLTRLRLHLENEKFGF